METKRVILDTNLWISFLISKNLDYVDGLLQNGKIKLLFSDELLDEFLSVVKRPRIQKFFSVDKVINLLSLFDVYGELVNVKSDVNYCRDENDNFLLNLAIDGKADYLLTGDADLLILEKVNSTKIMSWTTFILEKI